MTQEGKVLNVVLGAIAQCTSSGSAKESQE